MPGAGTGAGAGTGTGTRRGRGRTYQSPPESARDELALLVPAAAEAKDAGAMTEIGNRKWWRGVPIEQRAVEVEKTDSCVGCASE